MANTKIVFGEGTLNGLRAELDHLAVHKALIICSPGRRPGGERISNLIGSEHNAVFPGALPHIPVESFDDALEAINHIGADGFVVYGGGSVIGLGKSLAAETKLPYIAIPTTYSGSEMSPSWYVGTGKERRRGNTVKALAKTAIYDPALTLSLPAKMSVASGMNAMAHAVESLYAPDCNPVVEILAAEAVRRLGHSLPKIAERTGDISARAAALYGAWLASGFRASSGLEHAIAQRVRQRFDLDHALTHAIVLPYVAAFNWGEAPTAKLQVAAALEVENPVHKLTMINRAGGLPAGLRDIGLEENDVATAVELLVDSDFPNPRSFDRSDLTEIITQAWLGQTPDF